jgi:hypothetical protein
MKKLVLVASVVVLVLSVAAMTTAGNGKGKGKGPKKECAKIQDGVILTSSGEVMTVGFDEWGYNYQGRSFNGFYCDYRRELGACEEWVDDRLKMKWNDAWLSNTDCDGDGALDRHFGFETYIGSGAWLTNHMSGEYFDDEGKVCKWNYFVKIVAAPADAVKIDAIWYAADGELIGASIWTEFAILQEVSNDPCLGEHGLLFKSPVGPGLGKF